MTTRAKALVSRRQAVGVALLTPLAPATAGAAPPAVPMTKEALLTGLRATVDRDGFLSGDAIGKRYLARRQEAKPLAVLRPRTTAEVSAIMKLCSAARQPVVPQGGMTGLVGGAVAGTSEVLISFERMDMIEGLSATDRTLTVQAGVTLRAAQEKAAEAGFLLPIDFGARDTATLGGMVSTNAGGEEVVRYGMTRDSVLGLEAVLADGTVLSSMNKLIKNNAGYDLKQLFIGSEGTLGLVTRVVLRLRPKQASAVAAFVAVDHPDAVPTLLRHLEEDLGGSLTKFEIMWADYDAFVRKYYPEAKPPLGEGHTYYVIVETVGREAAVERTRLKQALDRAKRADVISDARIAQTEKERALFWEIREQAGARFSELGPFFGYDVSLSLADMPAFGAQIKRALAEAIPGCVTLTLGHVGDGNLHLIVAPGSRSTEIRRKADDIIYGAIRDVRGSVSAEHGIGTEKKDYLSWSRSPEEIALMRTLKSALDPLGILNAGKVL